MRRYLLFLSILLLLAPRPALPAPSSKGKAGGARICEVVNAAADLEAVPPTLLLEGRLCDAGIQPSVWLGRDGAPVPVPVLSWGDTSILADITG